MAAAFAIDLIGHVLLSPKIIGRLHAPLFVTEVRDRQSFGEIAVSFM